MTQARLHKSVSGVVTQPSFVPAVKLQKSVSGVVTQPTFVPAAKVQKAAAIVVVQPFAVFAAALVQKAVSVVVVQPDSSGDAFQPVALERPVYRTGGPRPYIEFTAGTSLSVNLVFAGDYTLLTYKADGTFDLQVLTLPAGPYELPAVNFNQAILYLGELSPIALASLKLTMPLRV